MTNRELLLAELALTSEELVGEVLDFLLFIKSKQPEAEQSQLKQPKGSHFLTPEQSTGQHLLEHLKKMDTWCGDDFEECLQLVYDTRGPITTKFVNPFGE